MTTNDSIILGGLAGVVGNVVKEAFTWCFYFSGLIDYTYVHFCIGMVINPATFVKDPLALIVGMVIDFTIASIFSIALYFLMRRTGSDYWFLKGLGFGMVIFLICFGVLRPTFSLKIKVTPLQTLLYMIPNLMYGVATSWFLKKYGTFRKRDHLEGIS